MENSVLIVGATGLIGGTYFDLIRNDELYDKVIVLTRSEITSIDGNARVEQHIMKFEFLEKCQSKIQARTVVCALGTTIKRAGSRGNFYNIDYELNLEIAQLAMKNGVENFVLISAIGANPASAVFYYQVKGKLEAALKQVGFKSLHILHPSLLLGERSEFRLGEKVGDVLSRPFSFLLPAKYRPIHASMIARKIDQLAKTPMAGLHIYEGNALRS